VLLLHLILDEVDEWAAGGVGSTESPKEQS
jgi:hypothetical protein